MNEKMARALRSIGALDKNDVVVTRRPITREEFEEVRKASVAIHDEWLGLQLHAAKFFNAPMQAVMLTPSGDMLELGCEHQWVMQPTSRTERGILDYRCHMCGATYTYDSSD